MTVLLFKGANTGTIYYNYDGLFLNIQHSMSDQVEFIGYNMRYNKDIIETIENETKTT